MWLAGQIPGFSIHELPGEGSFWNSTPSYLSFPTFQISSALADGSCYIFANLRPPCHTDTRIYDQNGRCNSEIRGTENILDDPSPGPRRKINLNSSSSKRSPMMTINSNSDSKSLRLEKKSIGRGKASKMNPDTVINLRSFMVGPKL